MRLHVYSLKHPVLSKEITLVGVKTPTGEITILDNHRPLITSIVKGPIRIQDVKGNEEQIQSEGGTLEVRPRGEVSILMH